MKYNFAGGESNPGTLATYCFLGEIKKCPGASATTDSELECQVENKEEVVIISPIKKKRMIMSVDSDNENVKEISDPSLASSSSSPSSSSSSNVCKPNISQDSGLHDTDDDKQDIIFPAIAKKRLGEKGGK